MKTFSLDSEKFPRVTRNSIVVYFGMALICVFVVYVYVRDALFGNAWMLIPAIFILFAGCCWLSLRDRKKYWESFELVFQSNILTRTAFKTPTIRLERAKVTEFREIKNGLIVSTRANRNALLIPRDLPDDDYEAVKQILENWTAGKS